MTARVHKRRCLAFKARVLARARATEPVRTSLLAMTKRKRVVEALRTTNQLLRAVTEGTTDAVFVKDPDARYLMMNSAGARFFGMSPEEVIGKDDAALFTAESAREMFERDLAIMASRRTETCETTSTSAAGVTRI